MKFFSKGFSLVELLVVIAILGVVLGAIMVTYTGTLRVFTNVKSASDPIETKTPSIELIARYFDRWGVGVIAKTHRGNCSVCPATPKSISITRNNNTGCDEVIFYGNIYGFGFVRDVQGTTSTAAKLISCRLDSSSGKNCYTLWRDNTPINDYDSNNNPIILGLVSLSQSNADCSTNIQPNTTHNATMDDEMSPHLGNNWRIVKPGDIIHRAAHEIKLYCANNINDNRKWLYVDLRDFYRVGNNMTCNENENATPIAPVDSFTVENLGCNDDTKKCAVKVIVTFRSQSPDYIGQYKTYTIERVFVR